VTQKKISNSWKETKTQKTKKFTWKIILPEEFQRSIPKISDEGIPKAVPKDNHVFNTQSGVNLTLYKE
jgi:hypothetical protein